MLTARIGVSSRGVDAHLAVEAGQTLALLGPNGSGKTTVIEALAGLVSADAGRAQLGETVLFDAGAPRSSLAPGLRGVALVTQDAALFPHLSVLDNVAYSLRARRVGRGVARATAGEWLDRVGCAGLGSRRPGTLSGGQARRVSVARALASDPRLVLLDEPFASLDIDATVALRGLLREVLDGRTAVISTHDGLDALDLASSAAVLSGGRVVESGATRDLFESPGTAFTASIAGLVWVEGTWERGGLLLPDGQAIRASGPGLLPGTSAAVTLDPRSVMIADENCGTSVHDTVVALEPRGDGGLRVRGAVLWADVSYSEAARYRPRVGAPVTWCLTTRPQAHSLA